MIGVGETPKAEQTIAENVRFGRETARLPCLDADIVEAAYRFDDRVGRMLQRRVGLHRNDKRLLFSEPRPRLPPVCSPPR